MNAIDLKRAEFRHYLEASGVINALSFALVKLYDELEKPSDPVAFVRQHFKRPNDENEYSGASKGIDEMDATELIKKQQEELNLARREIGKLQQMLNSMSANSQGITDNRKSISYENLFSDSNYENTMVKKHLPEELFKRLLEMETEYSIVDCISKVNSLQNNPIGLIAVNGDCFNKFSDLFDPVIKDIHCIDEFSKCPDSDWGDSSVFAKFENEEIVSIEISCSRSVAKIPFIPGVNEQLLEYILTTVQNVIQTTNSSQKSNCFGKSHCNSI